MVSKEFKSANYNTGIRVSEQSIQKLRSGGTFAANVASAKKQGSALTSQDREAMNRFYGKTRVSSALGTGTGSTANNGMSGIAPTKVGPAFNGVGTTGYKPPKGTSATPNKSAMNSAASNTGNFIKNELLGVDDFSKLRGQMKNHQYKNMAKSTLAGGLEVGTTALTIVGSVFTGGAAGAAVFGAKAASVAAKQGAKAVVKQGAKTTVKKAAMATGKAAATGSTKGAVKVVLKAPGAVMKASKGKTPLSAAGKNAVSTKKAYTAASAAYKAEKTAAANKFSKTLPASYDAMRKSRAVAAKAAVELTKKTAKGKITRKVARRAQVIHYGTSALTRKDGK